MAVSCAALLVTGLLAVTAVPASAAGSMRLRVSPPSVLTHQAAGLRATVAPHRKGRRVTFSWLSGGHWTKLGSARTNKHGVAALTTRFSTAGKQQVRAVADRFHGDRERTSASNVLVVAPDFVGLTAPEHAQVGSGFDVGVKVTAQPFALHNAALTLKVPTDGHQVRPPDTWTVDPKTHTATLRIGSLAKGATRTYPLGWQAPDTSGALPFSVTLTATDVAETHHTTVLVGSSGGGSFRFDQDLKTTGQSRTRNENVGSYYRSCATQVSARALPTFTETLSAIDDFTHSGTSTDAWQGLDLAHHPERADDVAGVAMGANQPAAALAAVIQGWRDTPNDGVFLNDAAALANAVQHPEWAIALETKAATLDLTGSTGIANTVIRLVNLGHAYAMSGDWATGKAYLTQAVALEPGNSQVHQELAAMTFCVGDHPGAAEQFGKSLRPAGTPPEDYTSSGPGGASSHRVSADKLWDLSLATAPVVQIPEIPATTADLSAEGGTQRGDGFWVDEYWRLHDRKNDLWDQEAQLRGQLAAEDLQPVTRQQINDILGNLQSDPALQQLEQKAGDAENDDILDPCDANSNAEFCGGQRTGRNCAENQAAFDRWHIAMNGWRNAVGAYIAAAWRVGSGMRAQLSDPIAWQLAGVMLEDQMTVEMSGIVQEVWYKSNALPVADDEGLACPWGSTTQPVPTPTKVTGADGKICSPSSLAARVSLAVEGDFGEGVEGVGWSIKQSCASTDFEADINPIPFLSGFVKASYNTDGSGVTYFAGSKASITGGGQSGSFESSFYITYDAHGKITDFGWDVGPETESGVGPVKIQTMSDHVRISFMSLFTDTPPT